MFNQVNTVYRHWITVLPKCNVALHEHMCAIKYLSVIPTGFNHESSSLDWKDVVGVIPTFSKFLLCIIAWMLVSVTLRLAGSSVQWKQTEIQLTVVGLVSHWSLKVYHSIGHKTGPDSSGSSWQTLIFYDLLIMWFDRHHMIQCSPGRNLWCLIHCSVKLVSGNLLRGIKVTAYVL